MRKLNGLILISALIMVCSTVNAQLVIKIDNQPIDPGVVDNIVIDPILNELHITTTANYVVNVEAVGDDVVITSFTASQVSVVVGEDVTFNWQASNADQCDATGGVDGWAATNIGVSGPRTIPTATVGEHTYTLTCSGLNGPATMSVDVTTTAADALAITTFNASPDAIMASGFTTISWATVNAESCTPTGGTADWISQNQNINASLSNGSANITIDDVGTYTFRLTCTGPNGDQLTRSDVVTVSPVAQSCDSVTLAGNTVDWRSFWFRDFPGPIYENIRNYIIPQNGYFAIEFDTGQVIDSGSILAHENPASPGVRIGSISQCPGDFNVPAACRYVWGLGGGLSWATDGSSGACNLDANTTYYFNITFTDGEDVNSSSCDSTPCRINLQYSNY